MAVASIRLLLLILQLTECYKKHSNHKRNTTYWFNGGLSTRYLFISMTPFHRDISSNAITSLPSGVFSNQEKMTWL